MNAFSSEKRWPFDIRPTGTQIYRRFKVHDLITCESKVQVVVSLGRYCLGTSPCIMGLTTQDPYIQKEHTELYKILKFRVNWANIEQDTAIQKLQNLVTNVWIAGQVL